MTIDKLEDAPRISPIRTIDFSNKADKARHDKMVELVTRMMELKKQQARAPLPVRARTQTGKKQSPSAKQLLDQKLAITDGQTDRLVYELYGLSDDEIRVVEDADGRQLTADGPRKGRWGELGTVTYYGAMSRPGTTRWSNW